MATKQDLADWMHDAVHANGGSATIVQVARHIWSNREAELRASGDLFYTWQYDMRWAANELRRTGRLRPAEVSPNGIWQAA